MGKSILTTGRIADRPYRLSIIDRNVYTVEELCYSIAQCASFLDEDFMDHELLVWLEQSCGLAELAAQLRSLLRGRCAVEDFASVILLYVGYQSTAEIERIRASISSGKGMEPFQRRLREAKFAASRGHVTQAIELMDGIEAELPELEREMRGRIWAEKGLLYAQGMRYAEAADCYGRACGGAAICPSRAGIQGLHSGAPRDGGGRPRAGSRGGDGREGVEKWKRGEAGQAPAGISSRRTGQIRRQLRAAQGPGAAGRLPGGQCALFLKKQLKTF